MDYSSVPLSISTLPAKSTPFQSVQTHSVTAGVVAQELYRSYLADRTRTKLASAMGLQDEMLASFVGYLVSMHDVGKLAPQFMYHIAQATDPSLVAALSENQLNPVIVSLKRAPHEQSSFEIMNRIWTERSSSRRMRRLFAGVLGAHHQRLPQDSAQEWTTDSAWMDLQEDLDRTMAETFHWAPEFGLPEVARSDAGFVGAVLNGLTILADWIASGEYFAYAENAIAQDGTEWIRERIHKFLSTSDLAPEDRPAWGDTFDDVWPQFAGQARPLQRELEDILRSKPDPALLLIEAPMGDGKTEAALYAASKLNCDGFYIALPTGATANQMASRVAEFVAQHQPAESSASRVRLLHSMAWLSDTTDHIVGSPTDEEGIAARWLDPVRRGLLAPYAVGTVDQSMMAAMSIRYGVLRLLGLAGKCLVCDEVHAYDAYMSVILTRLLAWCKAMGTPVVLLSATLPSDRRAELLAPYTDAPANAEVNSYPSITAVSWDGDVEVRQMEPGRSDRSVVVTVLPILHETDQIAAYAADLVRDGGCACVLVNTVGQAQELYRALVDKQDDSCALFLFHSRFPASRRAEIEQACLSAFGKDKSKRPRKAVLVATQVVEQSLDIDVDVLITSAAPVDLVLQRSGRMHRHDETERPDGLREPHLYMMTPANNDWGGDGRVYPECLLQRTTDIMQRVDSMQIPSDIPTLVEKGYSSENVPPEQIDAWLDHCLGDDFARTRGEQYCLSDPAAGFDPLTRMPQFDDLENAGYLSACTRLGSPSVRIALLEPELYVKVKEASESTDKGVCSQHLARLVMERSVSLPEDMLDGYDGGFFGSGRLAHVRMFPAHDGVYTSPNGKTITYDNQLGVLLA